jgi:hypothetical protein
MVARLFEPRLLLLYQIRLLGKSLKAGTDLAYYAFRCVLTDSRCYTLFLT